MNISDSKLRNMSAEELITLALEDIKDRPRHERRRYEKELKEHAKIAQTFNPAQQKFVEKVVEESAQILASKEIGKYKVMLERSVNAFITMEFEELSENEISKKSIELRNLIGEDLKLFEERMKDAKGDLEMANKKLEKYEEQIRVVCEELISNGTTQKSAIVILQDKFPTLSKTMVINAYKNFKEEFKKVEPCEVKTNDLEEDLKEIAKAAAEYIFEDEKEEVAVSEEVTPEVEKVETKAPSKLKIKSMIVEGENAVYAVTSEGVEADFNGGLISFADIESLKEYKQAEIEKINKITDEFEAVFAMI